jgi:hypothetical protein
MRRSFLPATALTVLALIAQAAPATATVAPVACGGIVAGSATLDRDLTCTAGRGITLSAGARLDLGGHVLKGAGTESGAALTVESGSAVVSNGVVRGWTTGLAVEAMGDAVGVRADRVSFIDDVTGVSAFSADVTISSSRFQDNGTAYGGLFSRAVVTGSTFTGNDTGVAASGGGSLSLTGSTFTDNDAGASCSDTTTTVSDSTFTDNGLALSSYYCNGTSVSNSTFTGNDTAYNADWEPDGGVDTIVGNRFRDNTAAITTSVSTRLVSNLFHRNGEGFHAEPLILDQTVAMDRNTFTYNRVAMEVLSPATVKGTVSIGNSGYGVYAPRAVDRGGNRAWFNGRRPQCVGVRC